MLILLSDVKLLKYIGTIWRTILAALPTVSLVQCMWVFVSSSLDNDSRKHCSFYLPSAYLETIKALWYLKCVAGIAQAQLATNYHGFHCAPLLAAHCPPLQCAIVLPENFYPAFIGRAAATQTDLRITKKEGNENYRFFGPTWFHVTA